MLLTQGVLWDVYHRGNHLRSRSHMKMAIAARVAAMNPIMMYCAMGL